ncbi:response regulator [Neptunomonas antarctica]|uniref:Response regulator receiver domain-containing protein n=1 Tax=Neptunomonas antarctica TaxID=619304 RepID=A0A1N7JBF2_9GAMM|nr:response regulator [Neptunomonas antarctica]SIS46655.1 Response regulator receiver domain-containing protein [Neptunomonas antarctica]
MHSPIIDYSVKRVLLIESSGNMRSTIVYMLRQLGIANIQAITINDQVMELIKESAFDIVLLGHNSSDALAGMQLLEESRYRGYIKPGTCWIFMTGDASQEVILHAIDCQPDALLTKPFTMEELKSRLDLMMYRKEALREVDAAVTRGQLDLAVKLCDRVELSGSNYDYVQLIKGRLLLRMNRFKEAEKFFKYRFMHLSEKESGLCLAEAYIGQERYVDAKNLLSTLMNKFPLLLPVYDLLAKVLEHEGEMLPAQDVLKNATQKSPLSLLRNMELGRVAVYTKTLELASTAYRKSISLGRHSCYRSPEPFLRLANIRRLEMLDAPEREQINLRNQFDELLNTASYQYPKDHTLRVKSALLKSQMSSDLGKEEDANRYMSEASKYAEKLHPSFDLRRELLDVTGDRLPILEKQPEPAVVKGVTHDPDMSIRVNRLGVKHYLADKIPQAIRYFGLAIENDPKNSRALLNLAQLFLESAKQQVARRDERLKMVARYLRLAERMTLTQIEMQKLTLLKKCSAVALEKLPDGSLGSLLK